MIKYSILKKYVYINFFIILKSFKILFNFNKSLNFKNFYFNKEKSINYYSYMYYYYLYSFNIYKINYIKNYKSFLNKKNLIFSPKYYNYFCKKKKINYKNKICSVLKKNNILNFLKYNLYCTDSNYIKNKIEINWVYNYIIIKCNNYFTNYYSNFFLFKIYDKYSDYNNNIFNNSILNLTNFNYFNFKYLLFFNKYNINFFCFNLLNNNNNNINYFPNYFKLNGYINYNLTSYLFINKNLSSKFLIFKNKKINVKKLTTFINFLLDFKNMNNFNNTLNINFISNKYLIKYLNIFDFSKHVNYKDNFLKNNFKIINNYYPLIACNNRVSSNILKKFKFNHNLEFLPLTNKLIIGFLENMFKKRVYIKINNNYFNKINNYYLDKLINEHRKYQPQYLKNFLIMDFIEIIWYSFYLKDLKMLSEWISKMMESLNFRNHKKFLSFFHNFLNKYSGLFMDSLKIKGFFFDIRGKVGVTGSSKKRHLCFKFGSINKSSKDCKINLNQSLVRTYSGVMGLTYIVCY